MKITTALYDDVRDHLKTGDVVLFRGEGTLALAVLVAQVMQGYHLPDARVTQVGLVVKDSFYDTLQVWESTTLISGTLRRSGIQISLLRERIRGFHGEVLVRRLSQPLSSQQLSELATFRRDMRGRGYEGRWHELLGVAVDKRINFGISELNALHSTELLIEFFQRSGLLSKPPSDNISPAQFCNLSCLCPDAQRLVVDDHLPVL